MGAQFGVLDEITALVDDRAVYLGHARQRCVLAALLMDANRVVSSDQLVDRVWADALPPRAHRTLASYLSRLRHALGISIEWRHNGYQLSADPAGIDAHRFRELAAKIRAERDDARALTLADEALGLWRGAPFTGLDTPWINEIRHALEKDKFAVELDRTDLLLRSGQHAGLLTELCARSEAHPLDERVAGQYMLALYRSGRQAEALDSYELIRRRLRDELGADPGAALRKVHHQVLTGSTVDASPRQLPAPPPVFTGRQAALAELDKVAAKDTMAIATVSGLGGVGKTWLVLHWAHHNARRFADGQLYVNLRGFDPAGEPLRPEIALRGLLDALGVDPAAIPLDLDAQTGLYRTLISGKRMLLVLDNARDTEQVLPLLPGTSSCAVIVTSRHQLAGLYASHGAVPVRLDTLADAEATQMLAAHLGPDVLTIEPDAVTELLSYCAGLPLAISIAAARATLSGLPLAALAKELHDAATRLDALDAGELSVNLRAVFSWSTQALDPAVGKLFRLLGHAPGIDITVPAAGALAQKPQALLNKLDKAHLIQRHQPGRYRMHDLVRLHAADGGPPDLAALHKLAEFYLHTAYACDRLLAPHRTAMALEPVAALEVPDAMAWFDAEHRNLMAVLRFAAIHGWHELVWQLAWSLSTFHRMRGHATESLAAWQAGTDAAEHLNDLARQSVARRFLGAAYTRLGKPAEAVRHLEQSLALAEEDLFKMHTYRILSWAWEQVGDDQRSLDTAEAALALAEQLDEAVWKADAENLVGWYCARLGLHDRARAHCQDALALCRRLQDHEGTAATLDSLGYIAHNTGQYAEAVSHFEGALAIVRDLGYSSSEAEILDRLGATRAAMGQPTQARHTWQQAIELYQSQHRTREAARVGSLLSTLD
ncbi:AfsR/SARP family transcriptional regulator [Kibdelosporangium aridum]|uniref:AfsR/SARP family transcriptional regulator n=1 Tax=Kibdelosporangium aridum TaxID=2030 RepID=UPI0035EEE582